MLLWGWRGLLAIWSILHVIKFEDVLSIQFADNIKAVDAWWKGLYYTLNNLTDAALGELQIMKFSLVKTCLFFASGHARSSSPMGRFIFIS